MKVPNLLNGKRRRVLKRLIKAVFKNHVYVSKHDMTRDFKVTGDLGFLQKISVSYEDRFLMNLNLAGKTVYDIGAHIGLMSLFFSKAVGETGQVISFEPNPETFATLSKNVELNKLTNIRLVNAGLAEKRDTMTLVFGEAEGGLGTLDKTQQAEIVRWGVKPKTAEVEVYPLDEYISLHSLPDPDFIKIDVEGYEGYVLSGMQDTLRYRKPSLLVELHGKGDKRLEILRKVMEPLTLHHYKIQEIISGQTVTEDNLEPAIKAKTLFCEPDSLHVGDSATKLK